MRSKDWKVVEMLDLYHKIGIDRALRARDTSCPKGKKVELRRIKTIGI